MPRTAPLLILIYLASLTLSPRPAHAGTSCSGTLTYQEQGIFDDRPPSCSTGARCYPPVIYGATFTPEPGCDPAIESFLRGSSRRGPARPDLTRGG